ncbi:MAG: branched-chain amino acid ABC transporter permease, partial [Clostridia bacterium]|nr:branched-chain amino acid ABC transporter permease [Clostridia bacterium]
IGIPVLRLKGDYLAIVTLAFGEIIKSIMNNLYIGLDASGLHVNMLKDTLNMTDGQVIISGPMGVSGNDKLSTFFAGFLLILICLFVIFNFVDSRAGRAVAAQRDNFIATESVGINITKYKLTAFTISAGMAGMAGTLFALNYSTVVASKFDFNTSILVLVFVVLGGLGNMKGSIIAAIVLTLLPELLRAFSTYRMLLYAIVLIIIMLITNNPEMKHAAETALSWIKGLFGRKKGGAVND